MFPILEFITGVLDVIKKLQSFVHDNDELRRTEAKIHREKVNDTIDELRLIVDRFCQTADSLQAAIAQQREVSYTLADLHVANRKLFEFTEDMRLLVHSIEKRFPAANTEQIQNITTHCLQIIEFEGVLTPRFVRNNRVKAFPIDLRDHPFIDCSKDTESTLYMFNFLLKEIIRLRTHISKALLDIA